MTLTISYNRYITFLTPFQNCFVGFRQELCLKMKYFYLKYQKLSIYGQKEEEHREMKSTYPNEFLSDFEEVLKRQSYLVK